MIKVKISFWLNIIIFFLVTLATIFMVTGFQFMRDLTIYDATGVGALKFFTVDSNILIGLSALITAIFEYKNIKSQKEIPVKIYAFKLISTSSVTLTFLVTILYLAPIVETGYLSMFQNSNLFFIIDILVFVCYSTV